jgi:hypothetical protein
MIINWRGDQDDTDKICHWAVSLGDGTAVGVHNSPGGMVGGKLVEVKFKGTGNFMFGIFEINVMNKIYMGNSTFSQLAQRSGCIIATIDPAGVPHRNDGD